MGGETTKQICRRNNLQIRLRNPLATQRSVAIQSTFDCNKCADFGIQLKAAESKIQQLQQELLQAQANADTQPCLKCAKRTNQRNIRQRNNQRKYREFFIANQTTIDGASKAE